MSNKGETGRFDWANKVAFQLTQPELAEMTAYFFFPTPTKKWVHNSPRGVVKGFRCRLAGKNVLLEYSSKGRDIRCPVVPRDQYLFRNFLLARLVSFQPDLSNDHHLQSLAKLARQL